MNEQVKSLLFLGFFVFVLFKACSGCFGTSSPSSLVGNKYELDEYHVVYFKTENLYMIYQEDWKNNFRSSCWGNGTWSAKDGKVFLDVNDSPCISTKDKTGSYSMSIFNSDSKQGDY